MDQRIWLLLLRLRIRKRRHMAMMQYMMYHYIAYVLKTPKRDSCLSGEMWINERMRGNHDAFVETFRMPRFVFCALLHTVITTGGISDSKYITAKEQLCMFLYFAGHHASSTNIQERFQHSGETVSRYLRRVVAALRNMSQRYIRLPSPTAAVHPVIATNPKFSPFFDNCRMAVDGTHIPVWVPANEAAPFHGRKGLTMNVMAACDFDLQFTYVLAGWEGTASDSKVYADAITKGLAPDDKKWDVMDGGFALSNKCLTPYRGTRYHLKEFGSGRQKPKNKEELFNLRHAQLRNCVERIFGVLKMRFPVLSSAVRYNYSFQVDLVIALCTVHNFARRHDTEGDRFVLGAENHDEEQDPDPRNHEEHNGDNSKAKAWRDGIAAAMWTQYQTTLRNRRRRS
ncbi:hypothetical protein H310_14493 [Aphanomyces invadans]|uniref:Uncharacterized protein n=1 Tax=Aphanomyces invadans TaxID=157072 RepID=A0A024T9D0_9STRA|nr:hypothetical protein H310_14493 [Aphanomyces invadans]ETV90755.1 hypothetical protein H310_14493 [Aphanomyces invadans]|eukprot:XP_008880591.1 hypothetical protein H310_14493 [Aphanomyces invadans]